MTNNQILNLDTMPNLLTTKEVSQILRVCKNFLDKDRISENPRIPFLKIGTAVRYKKSVIADILENGLEVKGA